MIDLKSLKSALEQLEEERNIPKEKIISAIEDALTAAYKKDYGKKGQIIRAKLDFDTGAVEFNQIKIVVDDTTVRMEAGDEENDEMPEGGVDENGEEVKPRFNEEHHMLLEDAKKIKKNVELGEEMVFPLETKDDYGRIAAQTAKQVIIQRIREAEKSSVLEEYSGKEGEIVGGKVQKIERGNVFVDLGRATGLLAYEDQIPGEYYRQGERIRAYLYRVDEGPKGITLRLSRNHPQFITELFKVEAPEIASGVVEIKATSREAGARTKIAVVSNDPNIDAVGSCVGQKGARVSTIINELGGEKIDIIEWSDKPQTFITNSLSPAKVNKVELDEEAKMARIEVDPDQFSLAVGRGGQNARLAAKLTGWKIDIFTPETEADKAPAGADETTEEGKVDDSE
jgi:N utilization substance protein A